ncbi:hypothetical protein Psch_03121 [Pelotomaculum schinkii]|uniref:Uncharacterized protein n=1 Tax=Pelotomaculum schinkii TaxID=78350 RepID=A0A4Y7RBE6_9FIRM|nr:hypothetical protein Psch_03121 [Pelotomaculum schinkii]
MHNCRILSIDCERTIAASAQAFQQAAGIYSSEALGIPLLTEPEYRDMRQVRKGVI